MKELEDSTLDLIYRRRVRSFYPGYVIMLAITGIFVAMPLIKIDIVATAGGMIRPLIEPTELFSTISGTLDSTILTNNRWVESGDKVAWIQKTHLQTRIDEYVKQIRRNKSYIWDISAILNGGRASQTTRYIQSGTSHLATLEHMEIQKSYLQTEYSIARKLFDQEVIPSQEYELAKSNFLVHSARITDIKEGYKKLLEEDLYRLTLETAGYEREIALIAASLQDYYIIAPVTGTIHNCPGMTSGSVIRSGVSLGIISPSGSLVAECYLSPVKITGTTPGTRVRLRFTGQDLRNHAHLETTVDHISNDIILVNGEPVYRIRCNLEAPHIYRSDGTREQVIKGMTFTASILRYRQSLASLLLERVNIWANPVLATNSQ